LRYNGHIFVKLIQNSLSQLIRECVCHCFVDSFVNLPMSFVSDSEVIAIFRRNSCLITIMVGGYLFRDYFDLDIILKL
ncbi:hypothetical protein PFISCL1PPCAC_11084, partial [Pristionchus fissidentatus]